MSMFDYLRFGFVRIRVTIRAGGTSLIQAAARASTKPRAKVRVKARVVTYGCRN